MSYASDASGLNVKNVLRRATFSSCGLILETITRKSIERPTKNEIRKNALTASRLSRHTPMDLAWQESGQFQLPIMKNACTRTKSPTSTLLAASFKESDCELTVTHHNNYLTKEIT